ncbi:antirepressor [Xenorhabdus miraniensis]|uniref:Antirepressor n=1 Tax=Xenorhabdus miraniensis TaxID=351674 RepID=A0A2D0JKE4_9GAMM|nr:BRO family protein [Xenorhabdus miraniensis]PHM46619.1 antirepressor [Xenorhabdus miraniensis]
MTIIAISKTNNTNQLTFRSNVFNPVSHANDIWLTAPELAKALQYKKTDAITQIYDRNSDEFTSAMTMTLNLRVNGINNSLRKKLVRVFSLRGAHLVAMFSKTSVAKEFRRWVLDILDREVENNPTVTKTTVQDRTPLRGLVNTLMGKYGLNSKKLFQMVHHEFGVNHIDELNNDQLPSAIEYLATKAIEGEFLGKEELPIPNNYSGFTGRLLMELERGEILYSQALTPSHHVSTLNDFMEIAQRAGYLLIHKEDMQPMMKALEGKFNA